jgi:hypothetical protein
MATKKSSATTANNEPASKRPAAKKSAPRKRVAKAAAAAAVPAPAAPAASGGDRLTGVAKTIGSTVGEMVAKAKHALHRENK